MQGKLLFLLLELLILPWCTITMTSETVVTPQETTTTASWLDDTNLTTESDLNATSSTTGGDFKIEMLINFIKNSVRTLKAVQTMRSVMRPILELEFLNEQSRKEDENQLFLPEPLLLTPYIDRRQLDLARSRSKVSGTFPDGSNFPLSYSGFITVDRVLGNNLFFWFFPSPTDPNAPLMVWMNGGPILSSMQGLLWSHGPLTYRRTRTGYEFTKRRDTWVGPFSVVYVDIVRRGYSFSNSGEEGEKADQPGYTADLHEFVKQFVVMFPESQTTGVYIAGQSYAGRFVPALAHSIHKDIKDGNCEINMKGVILGAPVINVPEQDHGTLDFLYSLGVISYGDMIRKKELVRIFYTYVRSSDYKTEGQRFGAYDITLSNELSKLGHNFITGQQADYNAMQALMGSPATRLMVHAGKQKYIHVNRDMYFKFEEDYFVNTHEKLGELLDSNYKVLIFNGNIDLIVNSLSIEQAIMSIPWHGGEEYKEVARHEWRVKEDLGFYSKVDNLCRVVVHGAGHNVAHDKPAICLHMMKDFLKFGCIGEDVTIPT